MTENSLRRLRRAAGFTSAKAFAESIGIPGPTYTRYEQMEDGPDTGMPIKNAWIIADALDLTIDEIIGRAPTVPEKSEAGALLRRFEALSEEGRELLTDFMGMLEEREERASKFRREAIANRFADSMYTHLIHFLGKAKLEEDPDGIIPIRKDALREMFAAYVEEQVTANWGKWVDEQLSELEKFNAERGIAIREADNPAGVEEVRPGEDGYEEALEAMLEGPREGFVKYTRGRIREAVDGVMTAYDELLPDEKGGEVEYALVSMP